MARSSFAARLGAAFRINHEIAARKYPNASYLGRLLGVNEKTIRRYLAMLPEIFGSKPVYDPHRYGYYHAGNAKPKFIPQLTSDEVVAVFLLDEARRSLSGSPIQAHLETALQKLSLMLSGSAGVSADEVAQALSLRFERAPVQCGDPRTLELLLRAIRIRRRVAMRYQGRGDGAQPAKPRKIDPLHLQRCEGQWYLASYCHLRKAIRTFVPARMSEVRLLAESFEPPARFEAREHFRTAFGIVAGQNVQEVSLLFQPRAAAIVRERLWHATQRLDGEPGGSLRLSMTCSHGEELLAWIMSWGDQVRVEKPAELARSVAEAHRLASAVYLLPSNDK